MWRPSDVYRFTRGYPYVTLPPPGAPGDSIRGDKGKMLEEGVFVRRLVLKEIKFRSLVGGRVFYIYSSFFPESF